MIFKLLDMCLNPKCKCQKQFIFTRNQFQLEGGGFKNTTGFLKPAVNTLAPVISIAVVAKNKNPQVGQATTKILKRVSAGKISSLTEPICTATVENKN